MYIRLSSHLSHEVELMNATLLYLPFSLGLMPYVLRSMTYKRKTSRFLTWTAYIPVPMPLLYGSDHRTLELTVFYCGTVCPAKKERPSQLQG